MSTAYDRLLDRVKELGRLAMNRNDIVLAQQQTQLIDMQRALGIHLEHMGDR